MSNQKCLRKTFVLVGAPEILFFLGGGNTLLFISNCNHTFICGGFYSTSSLTQIKKKIE